MPATIGKPIPFEKIRKYLDVDDLAYLPIEKLREAAPAGLGYCTACFDGDYPIPFEHEPSKEVLEGGANPARASQT